jgi:hypothetical protein
LARKKLRTRATLLRLVTAAVCAADSAQGDGIFRELRPYRFRYRFFLRSLVSRSLGDGLLRLSWRYRTMHWTDHRKKFPLLRTSTKEPEP